MAKANKKSAKEASKTFHDIMKASVKKNQLDRQERYERLYHKIESEMQKSGFIKETLMELCSVELDRNENDNQINFQFLLRTSLEAKTELKKSFDKYANQYGFVIDYINLMGDLY